MRRRFKVMDLISNVTLEEGYSFFVSAKRAENISGKTLSTYDLHIRSYIDYVYKDYPDLFTVLLNDELYYSYVDYLRNSKTKKDVTITSYCRSVRAFLYWLQDNYYSEKYSLSLPKYQKTIKRTYTDEELSILLSYRNDFTEVEYQAYVFINLICATGLRLSSALNLHVNDINFVTHELFVNYTKNNVAQMLYVNDDMINILSRYINLFRLSGDDWLFCTAQGGRLAIRTIQDNVHAYNTRLGVNKTSIHLFRHTFAKNYYKTTKDIYALSRLLNHSSIAITENYLRDLGISSADSVAYNPQKQFNKTTKKRRGKIK